MNIILNPDRTRKNVVSISEEKARDLKLLVDIQPDDMFISDAPMPPVGMLKPRFIDPINWEQRIKDGLPLWEEAAQQTELDAIQAQKESQQAQARLDEIDRESIRALRAVAAGTQTQADLDKLASLETEAEQYRLKITLS